MFLSVLFSVLPLFLIMLVGFLASGSEKFRNGAEPAISAFVFYIALPALLYKVVSEADIHAGIPLAFPVIIILTCLGFTVSAWAASRFILGQRARKALPAVLSASYGNVAYLGVPVVLGLLGPGAGLAAGIGQLAHNLFFMVLYPLAFGLMSSSTKEGNQPLRTKILGALNRALLRNPVVWGMATGAIIAFTGLQVPEPITETTTLLAAAAAPGALFAIGLTLRRAVSSMNSGAIPVIPVLIGTTAKLLVLPGVTAVIAMFFTRALPPEWFGTLVLMAAMPTSATAYILAQADDGDGEGSAATIVTTCAASVITLPILATVLLT